MFARDSASYRAALVSAAIGCVWLTLIGCAPTADSRTASAQASPATSVPVSVSVAPVTVRSAARQLKFVGSLYGSEEVTLSSQIEGQIREVRADLGDRVEVGQVLAEIERDQLEARLRVAEARLAKSRADEARGRELVARKVISPQEYETMKTAAAVAAAEHDGLVVLLRYSTVRSPVAGSVAGRMTSVGEYVRPGTPLFKLVADRTLKLRGDVPERFARDLAVGQEVRVAVDAWPGTTFTGRVERIAPAANSENRSITLEAAIDNRAGKLKPGFFATASVVTSADDQVLLVPEQAVVRFAGVTRLFVVRDGVAHQVAVRLGSRGGGGYVEILEGLQPGDFVATSGLAELRNGSPVSIREAGS